MVIAETLAKRKLSRDKSEKTRNKTRQHKELMARQDNNREHENAPRKIRGARAQRSCVGACKSTAPTHVRDRVRDKTKDIKDGRDKRWKREDNREKTEESRD